MDIEKEFLIKMLEVLGREDMPQPSICAGLRHVFAGINSMSERFYFVPKILSPASPSPGQM